MLLSKHEHPSRCVWLLKFVVDGDERLQCLGVGTTMELFLFVVETLGIRSTVHCTLPQQLTVEWEATLSVWERGGEGRKERRKVEWEGRMGEDGRTVRKEGEGEMDGETKGDMKEETEEEEG